MNEDYYPLITLIFLLPLLFSPYTIEGLFVEEKEVQSIVQFEYPKSLTDLKTDIQTQLQPELNQTHNESTNNFSSLTLMEADDHIVDFLEYQDAKQKNFYEVNLQEVFSLRDNTDIEYNDELNTLEIPIKDRKNP